jgi:hypothetical protein
MSVKWWTTYKRTLLILTIPERTLESHIENYKIHKKQSRTVQQKESGSGAPLQAITVLGATLQILRNCEFLVPQKLNMGHIFRRNLQSFPGAIAP